jgi:hypothetical protein
LSTIHIWHQKGKRLNGEAEAQARDLLRRLKDGLEIMTGTGQLGER